MIAIGSDHAGFAAKEHLKELLAEQGLASRDFGCFNEDSVHYPHYGLAVAQTVADGECERGILVCGTGIGMSIVANKVKGVRAALCHDVFTAQACREHNDANILVLGARILDEKQMAEIVEIWLNTPFAGGRHAERLAMIESLDN
jgi:ribose 5-phosphate isomerase B